MPFRSCSKLDSVKPRRSEAAYSRKVLQTECATLRSVLEMLFRTAQVEIAHNWKHAESFANHATILIRLHLEEGRTRDSRRGATLTDWQFRQIERYVKEHLHETIRLNDLSRCVHLSPSHFSRAFKGYCGISPHGFVVRQRVELAKALLLRGDCTLAEIATACGLADQTSLSALFRRSEEMSPTAWRRRWASKSFVIQSSRLALNAEAGD